jgi:nitrite reductase/ring-hydroxylating ferredoxin subunit
LISNLSAAALFTVARASRAEDGQATAASLLLGTVGAGLMAFGGWLGGTLVYRNEIGVDVRQAGAGKWRETTARLEPGRPLLAASSSELGQDQMKLVRLDDGRRIVLARLETGYVAFDDHCTHRGGSLAGGALVKGIVQCPWHGSQFDVRTGKVVQGPAEEGIRTYAVEEVEGEVRVRM